MGIRRNFVFNMILTISQYVTGLITLPYVSRALGVSNMGKISFVDSTINYFVLFTMLGISIVGTREVAMNRNDSKGLSTVFSSLVSIFTVSILVVLIVFVIVVFAIPEFRIFKNLFFIGAGKLVFSAFLIEWFYRGLENFRYVTIRTVLIKALYIAAIFTLVKDQDDYIVYFVVTTLVIAANALVNLLYSRKFVKFSLRHVSVKPYLKQIVILGGYLILTSTYTTFNVIYLGWVTDTTQVGYYWAATSIYSIILGIFAAFTGVMFPRMSNVVSGGNQHLFADLISKSFSGLFAFSIPFVICTFFLASQIVYLFAGPGYEGAVKPLQLVMPLVFVVGIAQVVAVQVLMPMKKDRVIFLASLAGAIVSIILNIILARKFGCIGTASVLLVTESIVTLVYLTYILRTALISFPWAELIHYLISSIPYAFFCYVSQLLFSDTCYLLITVGTLSIIYFMLLHTLILRKNVFREFFQSAGKYFLQP